MAVCAGHVLTVAALIRGGANINLSDKDGKAALDIANSRGRIHIAETLKNAGAVE